MSLDKKVYCLRVCKFYFLGTPPEKKTCPASLANFFSKFGALFSSGISGGCLVQAYLASCKESPLVIIPTLSTGRYTRMEIQTRRNGPLFWATSSLSIHNFLISSNKKFPSILIFRLHFIFSVPSRIRSFVNVIAAGMERRSKQDIISVLKVRKNTNGSDVIRSGFARHAWQRVPHAVSISLQARSISHNTRTSGILAMRDVTPTPSFLHGRWLTKKKLINRFRATLKWSST